VAEFNPGHASRIAAARNPARIPTTDPRRLAQCPTSGGGSPAAEPESQCEIIITRLAQSGRDGNFINVVTPAPAGAVAPAFVAQPGRAGDVILSDNEETSR